MPEPSPPRDADASGDDAVFRILTVCSGNLCRSPLAEQLLRARLSSPEWRDLAAVEVASAGTVARDGEPMDARAAGEADRLGLRDAGVHRTRRLRAEHVERADLVVAMAQEHRAACARLVPSATRRTFTLPELAAILTSLARADAPPLEQATGAGGAARLRAVVSAAGVERGMMPPWQGDELDIADPFRRGRLAHRRTARAVDGHVAVVAERLRELAQRR
ncbi:arsenate reductase/protein-tyrosine-phosphatase family protein [Agrococcus carbonis]|uniref:protein-tyrosine-phosphatase n=1 Tax=Agrococcus carbonis TaxID=684552 RepID=A0A1H1RFA2_9MICO|nr:hypothetical protein [Agrococcus carbonis]SDS34457.1 protein-tyrosine phosphatase [Agrococcus carbonis]